MEQNYTKIDHELPLIPLRGLAIFPYMILNFDIGREMSLKALDQAMLEDELVFLTSQKEAEVDEPTTDDFYHVGTICKVKQVIKLPGETVRVLVEDISRGKIKEIDDTMRTVVTKSKKVSTNLPASGWVGSDRNPPFSITISVSGVTATNNVEVLLPGTASLEQVEAWCDAGIVHGTQTDGSITLKGYNWKPEIDIPIEVIIRTDI